MNAEYEGASLICHKDREADKPLGREMAPKQTRSLAVQLLDTLPKFVLQAEHDRRL